MAAPEKNGVRTRKSPTAVFEIVEELPENPKREVGGGFGVSKWKGILEQVQANAPIEAWVKVMAYETANGAREGVKNLLENPGVFPAVADGTTFLADDRRADVTVTGEDGTETTERHSFLYLGIFPTDHPEVGRVSEKLAARAEAQEKRAATRAANEAAKAAAGEAGETVPDEDNEDDDED